MDKLTATQSAADRVVGVVSKEEELTAELSKPDILVATLIDTAESALTAQLSSEDKLSAAITVPEVAVEGETYDGTYIVIPKAVEQSLDTSAKYMKTDVTIEKIPYYETTNESGGYTVIIG